MPKTEKITIEVTNMEEVKQLVDGLFEQRQELADALAEILEASKSFGSLPMEITRNKAKELCKRFPHSAKCGAANRLAEIVLKQEGLLREIAISFHVVCREFNTYKTSARSQERHATLQRDNAVVYGAQLGFSRDQVLDEIQKYAPK